MIFKLFCVLAVHFQRCKMHAYSLMGGKYAGLAVVENAAVLLNQVLR